MPGLETVRALSWQGQAGEAPWQEGLLQPAPAPSQGLKQEARVALCLAFVKLGSHEDPTAEGIGAQARKLH